MKHQNGFTLFGLTIVLILLCGIVPWVWNAYKFTSCDFKSDYKCEVIHGAGVFIPPASLITVWFATDEERP